MDNVNQITTSPQANSQDDSSSSQQKQQDDQQNKPVTVRVGGPEGGSIVLEQAGSSSQEIGHETAKPVERAQEQAKEKVQEKQKPPSAPPKKAVSTQKKTKQKKIKKDPISDKVFGYKVPPAIAENYKSIPKKASRADTRRGLDCLYMFLDRLLRMQS